MFRVVRGRFGEVAHSKGARVTAVVATAVMMLVLPAGSLAVHDTGLFELDGNAVSANAVPPADDWDRVCHQATGGAVCAAASNTTGARGVEWTNDGALNATIFQTGGSKDPQDIPNWVWKDEAGGLPDKDNLLHSFAARYSGIPTNPALPPGPTACPNGTGGPGQPPFNPAIPCEVLYFGSDRYDNSGDAQQGFWLFQNPISLGNQSVAGGFNFNGAHANGDLLIISDFSNGGGTSTITVYKWDTACLAAGNPQPSCADSNLRTFASSAAAGCATAAPGDAFCGIVNANTITMPWPFLDKSGTPANGAINGEFFEGGINLSLLGVANQCFSSVLSETRSSTSTTATLKDFVLGGLQQCQAGLTTTPKDGTGGGSSPFSIGTGSVSVRDSAQVNIVGAANWSGTLRFFLCKVATVNDLCTAGGTKIGADKAIDQNTTQPILSDAATVTAAANGTPAAPGRYCWRGEFIGNAGIPSSTDATAGECFFVNPAQPALTTNATPTAAINTPISDTATLTGTANAPGNPIINGPLGPAAGGTITFNLYGPADPNCAGPPVFSTARAVSGNGTYPTAAQAAASFTPNATGTYRWVASYSGDSPNTLSTAGGCGDANETTNVVDLNIQITPSGVNEVGNAHTFNVTITAIPAGTVPVFSVTSIAIQGAPNVFNHTCAAAALQVNGNVATCTITVNRNAAGTVTVSVAAQATMGGLVVQRSTNGQAGSSGPATKRFVDANIAITPSGVNEVGNQHVFTISTTAIPSGTTPSLTSITPTVTSAIPGAALTQSDTCAAPNVVGNTATCTLTVNSTVAGEVTASATSKWHFVDNTPGANPAAADVTRTTSANQGGPGDAVKRFVDANISITPSATNEIGNRHVFTISTTALPSATTPSLTSITPKVTSALPAAALTQSDTCGAPTVVGNTATCTLTVNSTVPGVVTAEATSIWHFVDNTPGANPAVADVTRTTDSTHGSSGTATKTFVDANIQITPLSATNPVGKNHTFTGHVNVNAGAGGYVNAPNGTTITFVLTGAGSFVGPSTCTTAGGTGSCTVVIVSNAPGSSSVKAKTDVTVNGVTLHRETGDAKLGDSADATKLWADDAVRTDILDAAGNVVTTVGSGTVVHDKVFVSKAAGTPASVPNPTGTVVFHRYATIDCTGPSTDQTVALTPGAPSTAITDDFAPTSNMSYKADYLGDANYPPRSGACEPLTVTPAPAPAIAIVKNPKNQTVAVGGTATFTVMVTNAGNTVLTDVHVDDPLSPNCSRTKADIPALASMAPGATITYTCTKTNVRSAFDNVATATGTPPSGPNVSASDTAPVKVQPLKPVKKKVKKKKKPKVVSHKKPKATG